MKSKSARGVWLCGALFFCLCSIAFAHPGEDLEQAWKAQDVEKLVELHTPTCWKDETDSGRRLYEQITGKHLEFRLHDYRQSGSRAVATYDVHAGGERVDRVFTYFENDLVVAYDEQEVHAEFFLMGALNWMPRWYQPQGPMSSAELASLFVRMMFDGLRRVKTT